LYRKTDILKRAFDCVAGAVGLVALSWLILLLGVIIRLTSKGPAIFAQTRVGHREALFTCYKLRTMYVDTPTEATHNTSVSSVTPIGRLLRRLKLDELPQLWNVTKGEMSLVGPRPCLPLQMELIAERRRLGVFAVRPGITGLAQVRGIDMSDPLRLAEVDAEYVARRGVAYDLRLIMQTIVGAGGGDRVRN
jgi:O-antigen biosynthesis protein WbqP